jgi:hypothetical protein
LLDGVVGVAGGGGVVSLYGRGRLRMAELFEGIAERDGLLAVEEEGTNSGLGRRGHDFT